MVIAGGTKKFNRSEKLSLGEAEEQRLRAQALSQAD